MIINILIRHKDYMSINIPESLIKMIIIGEDKRFLTHYGVDFIAIVAAMYSNVRNRKLRGASTLEQQLTRTLTKNYKKTFRRKIQEIVLASTLRSHFSKVEIIYVYLYIAYFGWKMNGITQASRRLDFSIKHMTLEQCASLVARLKYPEPRYPSSIRREQIYKRTQSLITRFNSNSI